MERRREEVVLAMKKLHELAMRGEVNSLTELLDEHPLLLHRTMDDYCELETPLHVVAMLGHVDLAREILIRNKELVLEQDNEGRSPLHLAAAKGHIEMVKLLLQIETNSICTLQDHRGRTLLHGAAMKGRNGVLKELLSVNSDSTQILTHRGDTILHLAVKHNRLDTLKLLLTYTGISGLLNSKDFDGNTILHLAVEHKHTEIVKYLVGGSMQLVEMNVTNENGLTPLDVLLQSRSNFPDMEINKLLQDNRATRGSSRLNTGRKIEEKERIREWAGNMQSAMMVVASLIATVAFQAILSPAGGVWQEDDTQAGQTNVTRHKAGKSVMAYSNGSFTRNYLIYNTLSLISSLSTILLLISGLPIRKRFFMWILMFSLWAAITSMVLTYLVAVLFIFEGPYFKKSHNDGFERVLFGWCVLVAFVLLANAVRMVIWLVRRMYK